MSFFFNLTNLSSLNITLGFAQYNRNECQKIFPGGKVRLVLKAHNLTAICEPIV
jgi:hypothetical protein